MAWSCAAGYCNDTCSGCGGSYSTSCSNGCWSTCWGGCKYDCTSCSGAACVGSCSGCTGSCSGSCTGNCSGSCTGNCTGTCTGGCNTTCTGGCNTACNITCSGQTQTDNINKLSANEKILVSDIINLNTAITFEVVNRRGGSASAVTFAAGDLIDDAKIAILINNLKAAGQTAAYSATEGSPILKVLLNDLIDKVKAANNIEIPVS